MTEQTTSGVVITNKDIYDKVTDLEKTVTTMMPQKAQIADHEARIRAVERWKYGMPVSLVSGIVALLTEILHHAG